MSSLMPCSAQNSRIDIASGGPRIGGTLTLILESGSLCPIGSIAFGSVFFGGPACRFAASAVCAGFFPVISPRAIAVASVGLYEATLRRRSNLSLCELGAAPKTPKNAQNAQEQKWKV